MTGIPDITDMPGYNRLARDIAVDTLMKDPRAHMSYQHLYGRDDAVPAPPMYNIFRGRPIWDVSDHEVRTKLETCDVEKFSYKVTYARPGLQVSGDDFIFHLQKLARDLVDSVYEKYEDAIIDPGSMKLEQYPNWSDDLMNSEVYRMTVNAYVFGEKWYDPFEGFEW